VAAQEAAEWRNREWLTASIKKLETELAALNRRYRRLLTQESAQSDAAAAGDDDGGGGGAATRLSHELTACIEQLDAKSGRVLTLRAHLVQVQAEEAAAAAAPCPGPPPRVAPETAAAVLELGHRAAAERAVDRND
jgi:hypothetical protein